jgi:hypothetical protein
VTNTITSSEYRQQIAADMTEATLQTRVEQIALELGWLRYHTYDSRRSQAGFPDLVMVRRGRIVWRELKSMKGKVSTDQRKWLDALEKANADVGVWRPTDLLDGTVLAELMREPAE